MGVAPYIVFEGNPFVPYLWVFLVYMICKIWSGIPFSMIFIVIDRGIISYYICRTFLLDDISRYSLFICIFLTYIYSYIEGLINL